MNIVPNLNLVNNKDTRPYCLALEITIVWRKAFLETKDVVSTTLYAYCTGFGVLKAGQSRT